MLDSSPEMQRREFKNNARIKVDEIEVSSILGLSEATKVIKALEKRMRAHAKSLNLSKLLLLETKF